MTTCIKRWLSLVGRSFSCLVAVLLSLKAERSLACRRCWVRPSSCSRIFHSWFCFSWFAWYARHSPNSHRMLPSPTSSSRFWARWLSWSGYIQCCWCTQRLSAVALLSICRSARLLTLLSPESEILGQKRCSLLASAQPSSHSSPFGPLSQLGELSSIQSSPSSPIGLRTWRSNSLQPLTPSQRHLKA